MSEGSWSFRTNNGVAAIRTGALTVRSTPWLFLTGQYARWQEGNSWQRAKFGFQVVGLVSLFVRYFQYLLEVYHQGAGVNIETGLVVFLSLVYLVVVWMQFLHVQRISLSSIHDVSLDTSEGKLTVSFERGGNIRQWLGQSDVELELTPRSPDELREACEILRLRGFSIDGPSKANNSSRDQHSTSRTNLEREPSRSIE